MIARHDAAQVGGKRIYDRRAAPWLSCFIGDAIVRNGATQGRLHATDIDDDCAVVAIRECVARRIDQKLGDDQANFPASIGVHFERIAKQREANGAVGENRGGECSANPLQLDIDLDHPLLARRSQRSIRCGDAPQLFRDIAKRARADRIRRHALRPLQHRQDDCVVIDRSMCDFIDVKPRVLLRTRADRSPGFRPHGVPLSARLVVAPMP